MVLSPGLWLGWAELGCRHSGGSEEAARLTSSSPRPRLPVTMLPLLLLLLGRRRSAARPPPRRAVVAGL